MWLPAQPGRWRLAPFWPHLVQRAPVRSDAAGSAEDQLTVDIR